jgi:hypothetical protein
MFIGYIEQKIEREEYQVFFAFVSALQGIKRQRERKGRG